MRDTQLQIDIRKVIVLVNDSSMDKVIIYTNNLPPSSWPWVEPGQLMMYVGYAEGAQYVRDYFKVEPEVVTL